MGKSKKRPNQGQNLDHYEKYLKKAKDAKNPEEFKALLEESNSHYRGKRQYAPMRKGHCEYKNKGEHLVVLRLYIALKANPNALPTDKQLRRFRFWDFCYPAIHVWGYTIYTRHTFLFELLQKANAKEKLSNHLNNKVTFTEEMVNRIRAAYSDSRQTLLGFGGFFLASGMISTAIGAIGLAQVVQMASSTNLGFLIAGIALLTLGTALVGMCHSKTSCPKISVLKNASKKTKPLTSPTHE